jgi:hypothetical protein
MDYPDPEEIVLLGYTLNADIPPPGDLFHEYNGPPKRDVRSNYRKLINILDKEAEFRGEINQWNKIYFKRTSKTYLLYGGLIDNSYIDLFDKAFHTIMIAGQEQNAQRIAQFVRDAGVDLNRYIFRAGVMFSSTPLVRACSIEELRNGR